jgi:hypothetical protein
LGTGRPYTAAERDEWEEHGTVKKAMAAKNRRGDPSSAFEMQVSDEDEGSSDSEMSDVVNEDLLGSGRSKPIPILEVDASPGAPQKANVTTPVVTGGALRKNADGTISNPVMKPRRQKNKSTKV